MRWLKNCSFSILLGLVASGLMPVYPHQAFNPFDYFTITYSTTISRTQVIPSQSFDITVTGTAVCVQDLPFTPSDAVVTGRIVAEHENGAQFIIASSYTVSMSGFPTKSGESIQASENVRATLPPGSPLGTYEIYGELIEAKVKAVVWFNVNSYLPAQENFGSIKLVNQIEPPVQPPPPSVPAPPETIEPPPTTNPEVISPFPDPDQNPVQIPTGAIFAISNLSISSVSVKIGQTVTISAKLTNIGSATDSYPLELLINGAPVTDQAIKLDPGESRLIEYTITPDTPGLYRVKLMNLTSSFTVNDAPAENIITPPDDEISAGTDQPKKNESNGIGSYVILSVNVLLLGVIVWFIMHQRRIVNK